MPHVRSLRIFLTQNKLIGQTVWGVLPIVPKFNDYSHLYDVINALQKHS